jgi:hypothetical protein
MKLENEIRVTVAGKGEFILRKCERLKFGKNNLSDIKWYEYKIVNNDILDLKYDSVAVMSFAITEEIRESAAENIITNKVSDEKTPRPHIDYKTGNVHPSKEYVKENGYEVVRQLVLGRRLGPKTPDIKNYNDCEVYFYKNTPRQRTCLIHKACYYPLIEKDKSLEDDWRYKLLSAIWKAIPDELKDEKVNLVSE